MPDDVILFWHKHEGNIKGAPMFQAMHVTIKKIEIKITTICNKNKKM